MSWPACFWGVGFGVWGLLGLGVGVFGGVGFRCFGGTNACKRKNFIGQLENSFTASELTHYASITTKCPIYSRVVF